MMATEILHQLKHENILLKIILIILSVLFLATNAFWICNTYTETQVQAMTIHDFTEPELEHFRDLCNFTPLERQVFDIRAKGDSLEMIAEDLGYSAEYLKKVSQKVNNKIIRVL